MNARKEAGTVAAIYARYSTDLQREASIEDQLRLCQERAKTEGHRIGQSYSDYGTSGASLIRPGIQALLTDATQGKFDIVLAEALDRLSRDQEDIAAIYKRLTFAGVKLVTLSEGPISELHIGLKGTMNALFLKDLADKTRRGLRGRIEAGRSGGGNCYGYDVVRSFDRDGNPERGERTINAEQAATVREIFADYAKGLSPRAIAKSLNIRGINGPTGGSWGASTIHGNKDRGTGMLNNELYIGRLVWNRLRYIKDPTTGKRVSRLNPKEEWVVQDVPELRIIDQELWDAVKARQEKTALGKQVRNQTAGFWDRRRPRFLFSGLIKCGCCGGGFVKISQSHFGCATARNKGTCDNRRTIRHDLLESRVLEGLQHHLMADEYIALFCEEYTKHINTLRMEAGASNARDEARLGAIDKEQDRMLDLIAAGTIEGERIKGRWEKLEAERAEIRTRLENAGPVKETLLHPAMGTRYRQAISELRSALHQKDGKAEAVEALRALIERIVLHPSAEEQSGYNIDIEGELAGILSLCQTNKNAASVTESDIQQIKLVAGAGFEPATFRL
jgi:site-specific DNA recombinase